MADTPTPTESRVNLTWIHSDPRGLEQAFADANRRAAEQRWTKSAASVADLRALLLQTLAAAAVLGPNPPRPVFLSSGPVLGVSVLTPAAREDNRAIQSALMFGVLPLLGVTYEEAKRLGAAELQPARVETQGGDRPDGPTLERDAGVLPAIVLGSVAIVSFAVGLGAVLTVYFSQANELEALAVAADERVAKHAATLATAAARIEAHTQREQAAGKTLAWDPVELSWFEGLQKSTAELAKVPTPKLETTPKLGDVTKGIGEAVSDIGGAVKGAATGAGVGVGFLLAGLGVLWLMKEERRAAA